MTNLTLEAIIVDRAVEVTTAHRDPALAHLERRFQLDARRPPLEGVRTLEEALAKCGVMSETDLHGATSITGFDPRADYAAHALGALTEIADYVTPGGHLLALSKERTLVSLRFENAELLPPQTHGEGRIRIHDLAELNALARLIPLARQYAAKRGHDLGYFRVTPDLVTEVELFLEAKCRYCYDSVWARHSMAEPQGRALERKCQARPRTDEHTIPTPRSFEPY